MRNIKPEDSLHAVTRLHNIGKVGMTISSCIANASLQLAHPLTVQSFERERRRSDMVVLCRTISDSRFSTAFFANSYHKLYMLIKEHNIQRRGLK